MVVRVPASASQTNGPLRRTGRRSVGVVPKSWVVVGHALRGARIKGQIVGLRRSGDGVHVGEGLAGRAHRVLMNGASGLS